MLASAQAPENLVFLSVPIGWHETQNRLADHLLRPVAEETLGPGIPAGDDTVQGFANDRVIRPLHNCCQPQPYGFGLPPLGDVAKAPDAAYVSSRDVLNLRVSLQDSALCPFQQVI